MPLMDPMMLTICGGLAAVGGTLGYGLFHPRAGLFGPVLHEAPAAAGRVAITFDDGPSPQATDRVLEILDRHRAPAAFFIIGENGRRNPELIGRIHKAGHLLGNHTWDHHPWGLVWAWSYWRKQIERTDDLLAELIGRRPAIFRPPMGFKHPPLMRAAARAGQRVVAWSRRSFDGGRATEDSIVRRLTRGVRAGQILLLHDGARPGARRSPEAMLKALPRVITRLREMGLEPARVDEMLGIEGYRT